MFLSVSCVLFLTPYLRIYEEEDVSSGEDFGSEEEFEGEAEGSSDEGSGESEGSSDDGEDSGDSEDSGDEDGDAEMKEEAAPNNTIYIMGLGATVIDDDIKEMFADCGMYLLCRH